MRQRSAAARRVRIGAVAGMAALTSLWSTPASAAVPAGGRARTAVHPHLRPHTPLSARDRLLERATRRVGALLALEHAVRQDDDLSPADALVLEARLEDELALVRPILVRVERTETPGALRSSESRFEKTSPMFHLDKTSARLVIAADDASASAASQAETLAGLALGVARTTALAARQSESALWSSASQSLGGAKAKLAGVTTAVLEQTSAFTPAMHRSQTAVHEATDKLTETTSTVEELRALLAENG